jgi:hypothetical protein
MNSNVNNLTAINFANKTTPFNKLSQSPLQKSEAIDELMQNLDQSLFDDRDFFEYEYSIPKTKVVARTSIYSGVSRITSTNGR